MFGARNGLQWDGQDKRTYYLDVGTLRRNHDILTV